MQCGLELASPIMNHKTIRAFSFVAACLAAAGSASAVTFYGPLGYTSSANIPAGLYSGGPTVLENFEDGLLHASIVVSAGVIQGPGGLTDSVDGDDGAIDGSGTNGRSWFGNGPTGLRFTFPAGTTAAGIVWTDGAGTQSFSAFGPGGVLLGTIGPFNFDDNSFFGTTAEDRFFGVSDLGGIESIFISNTEGGIEVDHVQYGFAPVTTPVPTVPDAASTLPL
jgi:hypothetical protein